jgi:hypothetical protein
MSHGPFVYNGMNHRADTPTDAGIGGPDPANYVGSGDLPAFWSVSQITYGGNYAKGLCCAPIGNPVGILPGQPAAQFYTGPWQPLGMTQAEYYKWIGPRRTTVPGTFSGVTYLDNDAISQNRKGSWTLTGVSGSGYLYVDGALTINGDFHWRGLIYTEGPITFNGRVWMLGGLVCADPNGFSVKHVRATFLYSKDAITQAITTNSNQLYTLSWREVR